MSAQSVTGGQCVGGILFDQTYGYADLPAGYRFVQACDECELFEGDVSEADEAAARSLVTSFRATDVVWCSGRDFGDGEVASEDDTPGDWAVAMVEVAELRDHRTIDSAES